ncbi:MAG: hypothetical protein ACKOJB_07370 [Chthoniobacterales bacterium]
MQPWIPSTKKLEQEISNEDRQLKRLTDRLAKLDDTHLDAVLAKAEEMGRQLAAKREQLKELQRAGRRPIVKSVKEKDVVAALTQLRDLLQGDVGIAAHVLKALVGAVILETRHVEGQAKPQMVARFTINAVPALAVLERGKSSDRDNAPVPVWDSIHASPGGKPATTTGLAEAIVPLIYDRRAAARKPRKTKHKS